MCTKHEALSRKGLHITYTLELGSVLNFNAAHSETTTRCVLHRDLKKDGYG